MICKAIWERYLLKEMVKVFLLFLFSFYFLYTLIDYSMHLQEIMKSTRIAFGDLALYYAMLFSKRCDLLLPLAFLIAMLKVLCSLNRKNELIAFQAGGISIKRLMRPFSLAALVCVAFNYLNFEFIIPHSLNFIDRFEKTHFRKKQSSQKKKSGVHVLSLEDGNRLIYQNYNNEKKELFDVYWVLSADELWYMKYLSLGGLVPRGRQVDILSRSEKGLIEKGDSYENHSFEKLNIDFDLKNYITNPMENRSISELWSLMGKEKPFLKEKIGMIKTHFYLKLLMPWLSFFVLIGVSPYAIRFSRHMPVFLIYSLGIFGYLALFMIIGASCSLGESNVIAPFWALFTVPILISLFFGRKFLKMGSV